VPRQSHSNVQSLSGSKLPNGNVQAQALPDPRGGVSLLAVNCRVDAPEDRIILYVVSIYHEGMVKGAVANLYTDELLDQRRHVCAEIGTTSLQEDIEAIDQDCWRKIESRARPA
jgi:hypothetical protein